MVALHFAEHLTFELTSESSSPPPKGSVFSFSIIMTLGFHQKHPPEERPTYLIAQHKLKTPVHLQIEYKRNLEKNPAKQSYWGN